MPKKEHIHIVTDSKHKNLLSKLGEKNGSMTKAFERAIEYFDQAENIGTCDQCSIKSDYERAEQFRELLNVVSFTADNIYELLRYLKGDCSAGELLVRSREKAYQFGKQFISLLNVYPENNYDNLLDTVENWRKRTRFFKTIQVDRFSKRIIVRVNVLEDLPTFVLTGFIGFLESQNFSFDCELYQSDIILTWITPEKYELEKTKINQRIVKYIRDTEELMKSYLLKSGYILINPDLLDWIAKNFFNYQLIPASFSEPYNNIIINRGEAETQNAEEIFNLIINTLKKFNYIEEISGNFDNIKSLFKLKIVFRTPNLSNFVIQGMIMTLARWGWKLQAHRMESKISAVKFSYVGKEDPTILEPLYIINFSGYLNQQFQKLRMIPLDEYSDLTEGLYEVDPDKFYDIFRRQGLKIANAINFLAKNDLQKMREIAYYVVPQALKQSHRDPTSIDLIAGHQKFTAIFKESKIIEMEELRAVICGVAEGFGYTDIQSQINENMVIIEFSRPDEKEISTEPIKQVQ